MSTHIDCLGHVILDFTPVPTVTFVTVEDTWSTEFDDYLFSLGVEPNEPEFYEVCECEQDWTCGPCKAAGRFGGYTWIETRYDGMDD